MFVIFLYLHFVKGVLHLSTLCAPLFCMLTLVHTTNTSETYAANNKIVIFSSFRLISVLKAVKDAEKRNSLRDSLHSVLQHLRLKLVVVFIMVYLVTTTNLVRLEELCLHLIYLLVCDIFFQRFLL